MFSISDLRFSYNQKREVLRGVNLLIGEGEILCLLGSNGTGKTTLIRCILGFQRPSGGSIVMQDKDITNVQANKRAKMMAYVPQSSSLAFPYTVREVVLMGRVSHLRTGASHSAEDYAVVDDALERLKITHLAKRRYQELSGGERQMVLVARALAQQSKLLIMDEPTSNLDYHNQIKILSAIRQLSSQGLSILMTSHYPDHAFLACSHVALMGEGRILQYGDPEEVVTSESLTTLYKTPVVVTRTDIGTLKIKTCIPLLDEEQVKNAGMSFEKEGMDDYE